MLMVVSGLLMKMHLLVSGLLFGFSLLSFFTFSIHLDTFALFSYMHYTFNPGRESRGDYYIVFRLPNKGIHGSSSLVFVTRLPHPHPPKCRGKCCVCV